MSIQKWRGTTKKKKNIYIYHMSWNIYQWLDRYSSKSGFIARKWIALFVLLWGCGQTQFLKNETEYWVKMDLVSFLDNEQWTMIFGNSWTISYITSPWYFKDSCWVLIFLRAWRPSCLSLWNIIITKLNSRLSLNDFLNNLSQWWQDWKRNFDQMTANSFSNTWFFRDDDPGLVQGGKFFL